MISLKKVFPYILIICLFIYGGSAGFSQTKKEKKQWEKCQKKIEKIRGPSWDTSNISNKKIEILEKFIEKYPNNFYRNEARDKIEENVYKKLVSENSGLRKKSNDLIKALYKFIERYPESKMASVAKNRIQTLKDLKIKTLSQLKPSGNSGRNYREARLINQIIIKEELIDDARLIPPLLAIIENSKFDYSVQSLALQWLLKHEDPSVEAAFNRILRTTSRDHLRLKLFSRLVERNPAKAPEIFRTIINNMGNLTRVNYHYWQVEQLMEHYLKLGAPTHAEIIAFLYSDKKGLKKSAMNIVPKIGQPAIPLVLKFMESSVKKARIDAIDLLGEIGAHGVLDALFQQLNNKSWHVRNYTSKVLARKSVPALERLVSSLSEPASRRKWAVIKALGHIGSDASVEALAAGKLSASVRR